MPKPRRKRHTFRDANGKRIRIYADTMQRYAHLPPLTATEEPMPRKIKDPSLLIIDIATSGFKDDALPLEVACMLVDCRPPYDIIEHFSGVVKHDPGTLSAPDFHAPLVQECYTSENATRIPGKEGFLLAGPWSSAYAVLDHDCGFSLRFVQKYFPTFFKALPKCRVDLGGVQLLLGSRGVPKYVAPEGGRSYRAMDDCVLALDELIHWMTAPEAPASTVVEK